jgi:hypothetical protein
MAWKGGPDTRATSVLGLGQEREVRRQSLPGIGKDGAYRAWSNCSIWHGGKNTFV